MPPAAHLGAASIDITEWINSDDYAALQGYVDALRSSGNEPLSSKDYADLPPCLPQVFGN